MAGIDVVAHERRFPCRARADASSPVTRARCSASQRALCAAPRCPLCFLAVREVKAGRPGCLLALRRGATCRRAWSRQVSTVVEVSSLFLFRPNTPALADRPPPCTGRVYPSMAETSHELSTSVLERLGGCPVSPEEFHAAGRHSVGRRTRLTRLTLSAAPSI